MALGQGKIALARKKNPSRDGAGPVPIRLHRVLQHEIQKRQQADDALRLAEHRYRSIFEHALEGIFQTSQEGKYIAANPSLVKMYGYETFEELAGNINNIATQLYVQPNRREEFIRLMQRDGQVLHFESEVRRRDGRTIWISENVRSILDHAGNFLYYEGTVDDITELKLAREKVERALEAVEQAQQRLEDELAEAAGYVRGLLPELLTGPIETHWCYLPSSHLGGDGFGYHRLDDGTLALYLLDVSGHGVGSALLSISVMNILRTQLLVDTDFRDPGAVLAGLNRAFPRASNNEKILHDLVRRLPSPHAHAHLRQRRAPRGGPRRRPRPQLPSANGRAGHRHRAGPEISIREDRDPLARRALPFQRRRL